MADINRVVEIRASKPKQPKFAAGDCKYGTIGAANDGELFMWSNYGRAVSLRTGQATEYFKDLGIQPLKPNSIIELSVNEEQ